MLDPSLTTRQLIAGEVKGRGQGGRALVYPGLVVLTPRAPRVPRDPLAGVRHCLQPLGQGVHHDRSPARVVIAWLTPEWRQRCLRVAQDLVEEAFKELRTRKELEPEYQRVKAIEERWGY